jgi:hypothetical protein
MKKKVSKVKKPSLTKKYEQQKYLIIILVLLLVIFFGLPNAVLYSKIGLIRLLPLLLIFLAIPHFILKLLSVTNVFNTWVRIIASFSGILLIPIFGFWTGYLSDKDLEKHGKQTKGVVSQKWKSKNVWLFTCKFRIGDNEYETFSIMDKENKYQIGDTLTIRYSSQTPDINEIVELK